MPSAGQPTFKVWLRPKDKNVPIGVRERVSQGLWYTAQLNQDLTPDPGSRPGPTNLTEKPFSKPSETVAKLLIYTPAACKLQACNHKIPELIKLI